MLQVQSFVGLLALTALAWVFSENRRAVSCKAIAVALALQIGLGFLFLKVPAAQALFVALNDAVLVLQRATGEGARFVFGFLGGGVPPFAETFPGASFVLAFQALPIILVMSALSALLFYWRLLPLVVRAFSAVLERSLGVGGAVGTAAAANIFVGMVEAPLLIRPYLARLTRSELFTVMTVGMATVAGTVIVLYATFVGSRIEGALGHILAASLISAPAAILIARVMVPPDGAPTPGGIEPDRDISGAMQAITQGTASGVQLLIQVAALLLVMVALVALVNAGLGLLPDVAGVPLTLERLLGWVMAPVVWLIGLPWAEAQTGGMLMGVKTVLNEFLAYLQFSKLPPEALSDRSALIMTYALCGFANFGSLGIMIGGMVAMAPDCRETILTLAPRTLMSGTFATLMTGAVVGLLTPA
ncbi:MAG: NupC/NupG family nucleoside CNT transporter [Rhodospirillales bacterium]